MPPSSRSRISARQARPETSAFRVTKASKLNLQVAPSKQKLDAIEAIVLGKSQSQQKPSESNSSSKKRRRDALDSDAENEEGATRLQKQLRKARPTLTTVATPTPPASSPEPEILPETLQELIALHKSFVQALAVHFAHNGANGAIPLSALMPSMTRLWKRRTVNLQDVQRMLALWENVGQTTGKDIEHKKGPFKLVSVGVGNGQQTKVEWAWNELHGTFIENELHQKYTNAIEKLFQQAEKESFVCEPILHFPTLKCQIGTQTQARQEKITSIRDTILSKPNKVAFSSTTAAAAEPDFSSLSIKDPSEPAISREDKLKSRTLGLFDRLRAKQLQNSASSTPATSADLLRRRALHRLPELIDTLRLKQSQKLNQLLRSDLHGSPSDTRARSMRVSFSLEGLVQEIRDSAASAISAEEIRECISVLGREVPDTWCSVYLGDSMKCVTLQGEGWRKEQVREWCEREIAKMNRK